jgi:RimJ/RimL family protein N-acetyltransferase
LIRAYQEQARQRENIHSIVWQTVSDNHSTQNVYHQFGLKPKQCIDYELVLFEKKLL